MDRENNSNCIIIALPSGKLYKPSLELLENMGINLKTTKEINRKLIFYNYNQEYKYIIARPKDNPTYVECGAADMGIVGDDVLLEERKDVYKLLDLKFGKCKMVLAAPVGKMQNDYYKDNGYRLRVATNYPHIAGEYFRKKGIYVELIKLYGSVELAPQAGLADMIVDIVSTGRTLKDNKLAIIDEIVPLSAQLIVNRISYKTKHQRITKFIQNVERFITSESGKTAEYQ